jgi:hypothetical protein
MYISGIIQYLIWPLFIFVAWLIIRAALRYYETRFPENNQSGEEAAGKNDEIADATR